MEGRAQVQALSALRAGLPLILDPGGPSAGPPFWRRPKCVEVDWQRIGEATPPPTETPSTGAVPAN